jgi:Arc/MetJ family transcription regulator
MMGLPMGRISDLSYIGGVRRTTLDIDEEMLAKAREILGTRGIKDTVDEALREVVRAEAGKRFIARLKDNDEFGPETRERAWPKPPIS